MPKTLTARTVAALKPKPAPYYVSDALVRGLSLRIGVDGFKSWSLRYRVNRSLRRKTLGALDDLGLADARAMAKEDRKQVLKGHDPAEEKAARRTADTVGSFADVFIEQHAKKLKRAKAVASRLHNDILPRWRHRLMQDITSRDVRELIDGIAARPAPIAANRVRSLLSKFFNFAIEKEVVATNPVVGTPKPGEEKTRDRVLSHAEIRTFWTACEQMAPEMEAAWKLRLLLAQRATEIHDMRWEEVDLEARWWTIPKERSKNKLVHRVWLSDPALKILTTMRAAADAVVATREARGDTRANPIIYVLNGARGTRQQREAAATFTLPDFKGHDLRRTAATLMVDAGVQENIIEKVLNHAENGVTRRHYNRHSYDDPKRLALDSWARTLTSIVEQTPGAVLTFTRGER